MLVDVTVSDITKGHYDKGAWNGKYIVEGDSSKLDKEHTYVAIFNKDQSKVYIDAFRACKEFKIIYEAPMAVNKTPSHGRSPRNTLFVFELK